MEIVFCIGCAVFGLGLGALIAKTSMMNKCKHDYKLINEGDICHYDSHNRRVVTGFIKIYECKHCKRLNSNKITLND